MRPLSKEHILWSSPRCFSALLRAGVGLHSSCRAGMPAVWLSLPDTTAKQAKGYVARSAFKLLEIQERFHVILPGSNVLDLGCNPGAFLQVACQHLGTPSRGGCIVGIDINPPLVPKAFCDARVRVLQGNALGMSAEQLLGQLPQGGTVAGEGYHAVLSDMCHSTLGYAVADVARSLQLAWGTSELALGLQEPNQEDAPWDPGKPGVLLPGGSFVVKLLQGAGCEGYQRALRAHFRRVAWVQPRATKSESREIYLVGLGRTPGPRGADV